MFVAKLGTIIPYFLLMKNSIVFTVSELMEIEEYMAFVQENEDLEIALSMLWKYTANPAKNIV